MPFGESALNNKFNEALEALKQELHRHPLVTEYLRYKELVTNSVEINELESSIKKLQQLMTQNISDETLHAEYKRQYLNLKAKYDNHPYIINYNNLVTQLNDLLTELKTILDS